MGGAEFAAARGDCRCFGADAGTGGGRGGGADVVEVRSLDDTELRQRLEILRVEHRDLDAAIEALRAAGSQDQLQLARLKKRKLRLKDEIALIEDWLLPDIIA
jgi:hypothetical protein